MDDFLTLDVAHDVGHLDHKISYFRLTQSPPLLHYIAEGLYGGGTYATAAQLHDDVEVMPVLEVVVVFDDAMVVKRLQDDHLLPNLSQRAVPSQWPPIASEDPRLWG